MRINIHFIIIFLIIINPIFSEDTINILSNTGEKGVAITSFTKNLYLLSSTYIYNIINSNYHSIKNNTNANTANIKLNKNFVMLEASINTNTNESVFLIAENDESKNKINLYSLNITSTINNQNPKRIYSAQCSMHNSKLSLINVGIDKYVLSYIKDETSFENIWFKYTYYTGFEILRTFTIDNINVISGMSCFLLHDQFPMCFYSTKDSNTATSTINYHLNIIALDTVLTWKYPNKRTYNYQISDIFTNKIIFTKAIYLSGDHAVLCYFEDNQKLICDIKKLVLDFELFQLTLNGGLNTKYENSDCKNDIDKIDILKVEEQKFIVGCVKSNNEPIIDIIEIDSNYNTFSKNTMTLSSQVKSTLSLFIHEVTYEKDYYGLIFNDANDNKLKYAYLNLPFCLKKADKPFKSISFSAANTFTLSEYLDIKTENDKLSISSSFQNYKIISFSAQDDDHNYFNYQISKTDNTILICDTDISPNDELKIEPLTTNEYHSGKFYMEVAPVNSDGITGRSCLFEFDTVCYEGCSTCNKYESEATSTSKHNCITCKSSFYSLGDLCLRECSLIPGFYNVYISKTCKVHELEVVIDCPYNIWSLDQDTEYNVCTSSSFCPEELPYVYNISGECIKSCRYSEFKEGECLISNIPGGAQGAINIINDEIKNVGDYIFNYLDAEKINKSIIMYGHNITIEITETMRLQKAFNRKLDVSQIMNMTSCENYLRETKLISEDKEIIILKIDLRRNDTASTQVEYQLYNPNPDANGHYNPLSAAGCDDILLQTPLWVNDEYKKKIVELYTKKIDIFDINEQFYSDLCYPYHAVDFDADLTLEKRQRVYYYYNANLCEKSCKFIDIDLNTFQAICECPIKTTINLDITSQDLFEYVEQKDQKIVHEEKISNLKSMKCIKYIFSKDGFWGNWGSYFMMLMILGFIIVGIIWFYYGQDIILNKIRVLLDIILIKLGVKYDDKFRKKFEELKRKFKSNELEDEDVIPPEENNNNISNDIEIHNINENNDVIQSDNNKQVENEIIITKDKNKANEIEFIRKKGPKDNVFLHRSVIVNKEHNPDVIIDEKKEKNEYLTDIEKDLLTYERAKVLDDRTFCGYYWSLLKLRQLIIFTFFSFDDFNIFIIKLLSLFLLLSFNLVYNAIFFFDKIINEIYDDRGKYSLKLQILNIFISSILFSFTIILIRFIITCHKKLIKLKNMDSYEEAQKESFSIHKCLIIKYIIYYIVGIILLIVFWYFITSFCAIFHYTQNHLFLNAFISFCFSMIYPFIYLLIPAWFRYLALQKNHEKFYCISQNI